MKISASLLLFLYLAAGCTKPRVACAFPTFDCLQGTWIEKVHTDTGLGIREYIQVYVDTASKGEMLFDATGYAQVQTTQIAIGYYHFEELAHQDSVVLTSVWQKVTSHWYLKMISDQEIEVDYGLPPGPLSFKKRYIRE